MFALRVAARSLLLRQAVSAKVVLLRTSRASMSASHVYASSRSFSQDVQFASFNSPLRQRDSGERTTDSQPQKSLRLYNVPIDVTAQEVHKLFAQIAPVRTVTLKSANDGDAFQSALVHYETEEGPEKALEAHKENPWNLHGRKLIVRYGQGPLTYEPHHQLHLSNIPATMSEEDIRDMVKPYVVPQAVRISERGFAHIDCSTMEEAKLVMAGQAKQPLRDKTGREILVSYAKGSQPWRVLVVKAFKGTREQLREILDQQGCSPYIVGITLHADSQADPRGALYFVQCHDIAIAKEVRNMLRTSAAEHFKVDFARRPRFAQKG